MTINDLRNTVAIILNTNTSTLNKVTLSAAFTWCYLATKCGKKM